MNKGSEKLSELVPVAQLVSGARARICNQERLIVKLGSDFPGQHPKHRPEATSPILSLGQMLARENPKPLGDQEPRNNPAPAASAWAIPSNGVFAGGHLEEEHLFRELGPQRIPWGARKETAREATAVALVASGIVSQASPLSCDSRGSLSLFTARDQHWRMWVLGWETLQSQKVETSKRQF